MLSLYRQSLLGLKLGSADFCKGVPIVGVNKLGPCIGLMGVPLGMVADHTSVWQEQDQQQGGSV